MKTIRLRTHKEDSLLRFHPWVFSGAIANADKGIKEGDLVLVENCKGVAMGVGHYAIGSIAVRMLEFNTDHLSEDFLHERLLSAYRLRRHLMLIRPDNDTYRLVHGEGDFMPGLVVDIYGDTAVVQAHSVGMHLWREKIAQELMLIVEGLKNVYYKSEGTLPHKADISDPKDGYLIGSEGTCIGIENGLNFSVDWLRGQKTGFFVDQRENRSLLQHYSADKRVLNMFCYTGGFSVYALRGGATYVHSVDSSEKAVELAQHNVDLNFPQGANHKAIAKDAFNYLDSLSAADAPQYDIIILDPPAFAKHRDAIKNALRGYQRLNAKAFRLLPKGGLLFTFSCSQAINKEMFRLAVFSAAAETGRKVRILHQLTQPQDHPINIYHPEGEYLKGFVLAVD